MKTELFNILDDVRRDAISKSELEYGVRNIIDAIVVILEASNIGRKEGLLALEENYALGNTGTIIDDISHGFMMMVDGCDPMVIAEVLTNDYWANQYTGNDALKQYCLIRGVLLVQQGAHPVTIERILVSLLPTVYHDMVYNELEEKRKLIEAKNEERMLSWYENWEGVDTSNFKYIDKINELNLLISRLYDKDIQRILREVDNADLELALIVISKETRERFLNNLSRRLKFMILEDMRNSVQYFSLYQRNAGQAVERIIGITNRLASYGDIMMIPLE